MIHNIKRKRLNSLVHKLLTNCILEGNIEGRIQLIRR